MEDDISSTGKLGRKVKKLVEQIPAPKSPVQGIVEKLGIDNLDITISLNQEQVDVITRELGEIGDRMEHRWKITQWLIAVGMLLNAASYIIPYWV